MEHDQSKESRMLKLGDDAGRLLEDVFKGKYAKYLISRHRRRLVGYPLDNKIVYLENLTHTLEYLQGMKGGENQQFIQPMYLMEEECLIKYLERGVGAR